MTINLLVNLNGFRISWEIAEAHLGMNLYSRAFLEWIRPSLNVAAPTHAYGLVGIEEKREKVRQGVLAFSLSTSCLP